MHILCKEKDYYDYVGYENGFDPATDVTFDRRNMDMITPGQDYNRNGIEDIVSSIADGCPEGAVVGVWIGFTLYIFKIWADPDRWDHRITGTYLKKGFKWTSELLASRKVYDVSHPHAIDFVYISTPLFEHYNWKLNSWKDWRIYENAKKDPSYILKEYASGNVANWKFKPLWGYDWNIKDQDYKMPILKNTWIPKWVSAKDAYYGIEEWLIAQHNDVDQESEGLTDVDKAINHGFDKKASFRNIK